MSWIRGERWVGNNDQDRMAADRISALACGCICHACVQKHWRAMLAILREVEGMLRPTGWAVFETDSRGIRMHDIYTDEKGWQPKAGLLECEGYGRVLWFQSKSDTEGLIRALGRGVPVLVFKDTLEGVPEDDG